jgi:two-component system, sporulation sensor kinase E
LAKEYLTAAEIELQRVSAIANQTLRFHRQTTNQRRVTFDDLINSTLPIFQGRLNNSHIAIERSNRTTHPVLCFDGEIRQVLSNLIGNATDAMNATGGRLLIRSREGTHWATGRAGVFLTVADTGPGMSPETLSQIFEPFFTTKGISGTGLGLWISHEIVDRHHGTLRVRSSQSPHYPGTVFTLFLPCD